MTQGAVYNFSLPNRSGSRRPFSPNSVAAEDGDAHNCSCSRMNSIKKGTMHADLQMDGCVDGRDDNADSSHEPADRVHVRSPTPAALQLFQFTDDNNNNNNITASSSVRAQHRSSRTLPRPMSTSSSAPALGGIDTSTSVIVYDGGTGPISPMSVWPRPLSEQFDNRPGLQQESGVVSAGNTAINPPCSSNTPQAAPAQAAAQREEESASSPPPLARSISIRWGPRLRHISMSEVQAADDAVRRMAAARRERLVFWTLVTVALVGVLSCTAAVTLAAAQAALQAGLEDAEGDGSGLIWNARTLGWLIASLILCATAAVGLAVATSTRCRRSRRLVVGVSQTPTPPSTTEPGQPSPTTGQPTTRTQETNRRVAAARKNANHGVLAGATRRLSAMFASWHEEDGTKERRAWVEMHEMDGESRPSPKEEITPRWWHFGKGHAHVQERHMYMAQENGKESKEADEADEAKEEDKQVNDANDLRTKDGCCCSGDGTADLPDEEDRNWAKFSQDPVQLRRYVESLEARLAGLPDAPVDKPSKPDDGHDHGHSPSPKHIRIRPSTSVRTNGTAKTETTIQPVMGAAGLSAPHSAHSLLLPAGSASVVSSPSPRRPQQAGCPGRDLTGSPRTPAPAPATTLLPASNTQGSILGQLYASYGERDRV